SCLSLLPETMQAKLPWRVVRYEHVPAGELRRLEMTWMKSPGQQVLLPRPTAHLAEVILKTCRAQERRPIAWCVIDVASEKNARLAVRLTECWGEGIVCLSSNPEWLGDHGLSAEESAIVQWQCRVRAWWGDKGQLDPFRILAALLHGCLPLQW